MKESWADNTDPTPQNNDGTQQHGPAKCFETRNKSFATPVAKHSLREAFVAGASLANLRCLKGPYFYNKGLPKKVVVGRLLLPQTELTSGTVSRRGEDLVVYCFSRSNTASASCQVAGGDEVSLAVAAETIKWHDR